jgi:hypothetical protein
MQALLRAFTWMPAIRDARDHATAMPVRLRLRSLVRLQVRLRHAPACVRYARA